MLYRDTANFPLPLQSPVAIAMVLEFLLAAACAAASAIDALTLPVVYNLSLVQLIPLTERNQVGCLFFNTLITINMLTILNNNFSFHQLILAGM